MFWYSAPLIEPMLHFSSPKRSVKLKAQSKTGSANSNPTGESKPIAIFGFVPNAFPIVIMTVERLLPPTTDVLDLVLACYAAVDDAEQRDDRALCRPSRGSSCIVCSTAHDLRSGHYPGNL